MGLSNGDSVHKQNHKWSVSAGELIYIYMAMKTLFKNISYYIVIYVD